MLGIRYIVSPAAMKGSSRFSKRKQLKLFLIGSISLYIFVWCYVLGYLSKAVDENKNTHIIRSSPLFLTNPLSAAAGDNHLIQQQQKQQHHQVQVQKQQSPSSSSKQQKTISNPWYGWQPKIAPSMKCSWRKCFDGKVCINLVLVARS